MPRIVTRAEWHARAPRTTPQRVSISSRTATCVHHDGANVITVRSFAEACVRIRTDQNYHMDGQRWNDIGYNYLVISAPGVAGVDGLIFEGRGRDVVGAHCLNWNTPWIGIQVAIGGGQTPSPAALASVRWLHDMCASAAGHSLAKKVHSDGFSTACPDPKLRAWVRAGMPVAVRPPYDPPDRGDTRPLILTGVLDRATIGRMHEWVGLPVAYTTDRAMWRAIQHRVGGLSILGLPNKTMWRAIQRLTGAYADGVPGPITIRHWQIYLNAHRSV